MNKTGNSQLRPTSSSPTGHWKNKLAKIIPAPFFLVLFISGTVRLIYYTALLNTKTYDTAAYINYHANILKGQIDILRTPVYPYFIKLIGLFGQQNLISHIAVAQSTISFLSVIIFYKIVQALFKKPWVIFVASIVYGVMLPVINFDVIVLTESLSVSCVLIFIYMLVRYLQQPTNIKSWIITLYVFAAIMLRPSFIYLLPLIILFFALRMLIFKKDWKMCLSGLSASVIVVLLIMGYSKLNEKNNGFNGLSVVSNTNEIAVIINANMYMNGNDPEMSRVIKANLQLVQKSSGAGSPGTNVNVPFEPDRINKFIGNCIRNQPVTYLQYAGNKLLELQTKNIFTNYADHKLTLLAFKVETIEYLIFCITFNILYFFLVLGLILIVAGGISRKQVPWFKIFLWLIITGQIAVAILGGYSEYQRLILPAIPALIVLLFSFIDKLSFAIDKDKLRSYPASV